MKIIEENNLRVLVSKEGYLLKAKEDVYQESYEDENGNTIREHIPYYFERAYIPESITLEKAKEMYEEIKESDVIDYGKN